MPLRETMRTILLALERACEALGRCEIEHEIVIRRSAHMIRRNGALWTAAEDEKERLALVDHGRDKEGRFPSPGLKRL